MNIGLLTFHNALNYGAALQAYASQEAIKSLGVNCEVVDYVNEHRRNTYNMTKHIKEAIRNRDFKMVLRYCVGSIFIGLRRRKFLDFYKKHLSYTSVQYTKKEELVKLNHVFDKFVVGSDQVWNYRHNGKDFAYLLDFVGDKEKKISYASSFGLAEIPQGLKQAYEDSLNDIKCLSTREEYGVNIIKTLTDRKAELVLDPVFLLSKKQWLALSPQFKTKKKYVFVYTNRPKQWETFLNTTGYKMDNKRAHKISRSLTVKDFIDSKIKVSYYISPKDFISEIANAELVVSASFHCIAMAIILGVPFVAILTGDKGKDERIKNILKISGLEDRIFTENMTENDVTKTIDYCSVNNSLKKYIDKSYKFLSKSIQA